MIRYVAITPPQRFLLDWERAEAASALVASLYLLERSTREASDSIAFPVSLDELDWERTDPANFLAMADALGSRNVSAACFAIFEDVCFKFGMIGSPMLPVHRTKPR